MKYLFFTVLGYFSGSVLYGYWLPKWFKNIDVCEQSNDGNPGTANAFIHAGVGIGSMVILCELLKGILPVYFAVRCLDVRNWLFVPVVLAPVLGHAFPFFSKGKGGKSIAVSFGVLLGFFPNLNYALALAVFYLIFSLLFVVEPHFYRSIYTFVCFSIAGSLLAPDWIMGVCCILISVIVIIKHLEKYHGEKPRIYFGFWNKRKRGVEIGIDIENSATEEIVNKVEAETRMEEKKL